LGTLEVPMPIRYILKQLLMPPGVLVLLIVLAWWLRRRFPRLAGACFVLGCGGLWLMSLPLVVEWSARQLEREPALSAAQWPALAQRADAIVILGAGREQNDPACRWRPAAACTTVSRPARRR
jgi:uncharacterized SAM-binding protein YcdF (DUF218 family)